MKLLGKNLILWLLLTAPGLSFGAPNQGMEIGVSAPDDLEKPRENAKAKEMVERFRSEGFQKRLKEESERIKREVFPDVLQEGDPNSSSEKEVKNAGGLSEDEWIYVFISESVPLQTLRNLVADVAKGQESHATIVLRGFVGGMTEILPTARFVSSLLSKDPDCDLFVEQHCPSHPVNIQVDPNLFRRYHIEQVPAVVFAQGAGPLDGISGSEGLQERISVAKWFAFFGDGSLEYSLKRINRKAKSPGLKGLIQKLTKGFY